MSNNGVGPRLTSTGRNLQLGQWDHAGTPVRVGCSVVVQVQPFHLISCVLVQLLHLFCEFVHVQSILYFFDYVFKLSKMKILEIMTGFYFYFYFGRKKIVERKRVQSPTQFPTENCTDLIKKILYFGTVAMFRVYYYFLYL